MQHGFSIIATMRTYSIELRERNYPKFEGRYNAYVSCYGQLSGQYLGNIEEPIKMNVTESDIPDLLLSAESFIKEKSHTPVSVW